MSTPNCTTYSVYRIVCFVTGKCYIGRTNDLKKRKRVHFRHLKVGTHHCEKLQRAYDKYGITTFYFEPLESDISKDKINERERYWISHFNSYRNGFNQTPGGDAASNENNKRPCEWNGIKYDSLLSAGKANGLTSHAMLHRLQRGYTCDEDMPYNRPCIWNGNIYETITIAAKAVGVKIPTMVYRLRLGYTCDADIKQSGDANKKQCMWNGIEYPSKAACARALGITTGALKERYLRGYTCDTDMVGHYNQGGKSCIWDGVEYPSVSAAARAVGICPQAMDKRLKKRFYKEGY